VHSYKKTIFCQIISHQEFLALTFGGWLLYN
jgi:hypothetical protein